MYRHDDLADFLSVSQLHKMHHLTCMLRSSWLLLKLFGMRSSAACIWQPVQSIGVHWASDQAQHCNATDANALALHLRRFLTSSINLPIPGMGNVQISAFRLVWRTIYVCIVTFIALLAPFFNDIVGIMGR